jgi:hypothetical protein
LRARPIAVLTRKLAATAENPANPAKVNAAILPAPATAVAVEIAATIAVIAI